MKHRRIAAILGIFMLLCPSLPSACAVEPGTAQPPAQTEEPAPAPQEPEKTDAPWRVSLPDGLVVESGETINYLSVTAGIVPQPINGCYPGGLVIEAGGQIVVKAGGSLSIGKLAIGSAEPSPVLRGALQSGGLIRVEAGGRLHLNEAALETTGEGFAIVQEDGGVVENYGTDLTGLVQWGAPIVDNLSEPVDDLWLETGTPLTEDVLPKEQKTVLITEGRPQNVTLPVRWELPAPVTGDQVTLTGAYLDETGAELRSVLPLTVTVHWYTPETIVITKASWQGLNVPSIWLYVTLLPEDAEIWAEYSEDGGASWTWLEIPDVDRETLSCWIIPPDSTPRLYRITAESYDGTRHWVSDSVLLPKDGDSAYDSGGNRGGSTDPAPPDREPTPPQDDGASEDAGPDTDEDSSSGRRPNRGPRPSRKPSADPVDEPVTESHPVFRPGDSAPLFFPTLDAPAVTGSEAQTEPLPPEQETVEPPAPAEAPATVSAAEPSSVPDGSALEQEPGLDAAAPSSPEPTGEDESPRSETPAQADAPAQTPASPAPLPAAMQAALAAAGLGGCALAGIGLSRLLQKRKP